jgi:fucose permease
MLIDVTSPAVHTTVTATAVLGASLLGLAPGPYLVGVISDIATLKTALTVAPLISIVAAVMFVLASRYYESDIAKREPGPERAVD